MRDTDLCKWLRENSSGVYRPAADAANRIEELSQRLDEALNKLPSSDRGELLLSWLPEKKFQ